MPFEAKGGWIRERKRNPKQFSEFRSKPSRTGSHLLILGKLKSTDGWAVQAVLHPLSEKESFCNDEVLLEEECDRFY